MLQILQRLRLVEEKDLYNKNIHFKDVNDLVDLTDNTNLSIHKINCFAIDKFERLKTCWYVDEANK